ncbi:MAG: hypothetical protein NWE89_01185 [Candidatus Bathyarchaeota archaeon]|nr:hypothetical protein [Candidatus Bathyarchaeota archaeon]
MRVRYRHVVFFFGVVGLIVLGSTYYLFTIDYITRAEFVNIFVSFSLGISALIFGATSVVSTQISLRQEGNVERVGRAKDKFRDKLEFYSPLKYEADNREKFRVDEWFNRLDINYEVYKYYNIHAEEELKKELSRYYAIYKDRDYQYASNSTKDKWIEFRNRICDIIDEDFSKILELYEAHTRTDDSVLKAIKNKKDNKENN